MTTEKKADPFHRVNCSIVAIADEEGVDVEFLFPESLLDKPEAQAYIYYSVAKYALEILEDFKREGDIDYMELDGWEMRKIILGY